MPIEIARENIAKNGLTGRVDTLAGTSSKTTSARVTISSGSPRSSTATTRPVSGHHRQGGGGAQPRRHPGIQDFYLNADGASPAGAAMFGVHMLAVTPGAGPTPWEVASLMAAAGLTAPEFMQSGMDASLLMAKKE